MKRIDDHRIIKEIQVINGDKVNNYIEKVHLLELEDFISFCAYAGLKIINTFGDYQLNKFDPDNSDRLILIAEKI